jgi:hypothetical protein
VADLLSAIRMAKDSSAAPLAPPAPAPAPAAPATNTRLAEVNALKALAPKDREAVTSDDPRAIEKLQAKLAYLTAWGALMRDANKLVRKDDVPGLVRLGFPEKLATELLKPDFAGRKGFADYMMTNNNGEIGRTRKRIQELPAAASPAQAQADPGLIEADEAERILLAAGIASGSLADHWPKPVDSGMVDAPGRGGKMLRRNMFRRSEVQAAADAFVAASAGASAATQGDPASANPNADRLAMLRQVADGTHPRITEPAFVDEVLAMFEANPDDAELQAMADEVARGMSEAAMKKARAVAA